MLGFPGEGTNPYLVFKGVASSGHPLKVILPTNYPMSPPRIYFDTQMQREQLTGLSYFNEQTMQLEADSIKQWRGNYTLLQAVTDTCTTILMNPPRQIGGAP